LQGFNLGKKLLGYFQRRSSDIGILVSRAHCHVDQDVDA
jgi:hypothetical protein